MNVYLYLICRNEEKYIKPTLEAIFNQSLTPSKVLIINDGSTDNTKQICEQFNVEILDLPPHKQSYINTLKMAWLLNHAFPIPNGFDYITEMGADLILPSNYLEEITGYMEKDPRLVVASGYVVGEKKTIRGAGRTKKTWFWNTYMKEYPIVYNYEPYELYKAESLGLKWACVDLPIIAQRPSKNYNDIFGRAMKERSYFPPYAFVVCLKNFLKNRNIGMLKNYLFTDYVLWDKELRNWIRLKQLNMRKKERDKEVLPSPRYSNLFSG